MDPILCHESIIFLRVVIFTIVNAFSFSSPLLMLIAQAINLSSNIYRSESGLIYIDYANASLPRTPKASTAYLKKVAEQRYASSVSSEPTWSQGFLRSGCRIPDVKSCCVMSKSRLAAFQQRVVEIWQIMFLYVFVSLRTTNKNPKT